MEPSCSADNVFKTISNPIETLFSVNKHWTSGANPCRTGPHHNPDPHKLLDPTATRVGSFGVQHRSPRRHLITWLIVVAPLTTSLHWAPENAPLPPHKWGVCLIYTPVAMATTGTPELNHLEPTLPLTPPLVLQVDATQTADSQTQPKTVQNGSWGLLWSQLP